MMDRRQVEDRLVEYVAGTLSRAEHEAVRAAVDASPDLRRALGETEAVLAGLAEALDPVPPPRAAWARLRAAMEAGGWGRFAALVARVWDLPVDTVHAVFARSRAAAEWEPGPVPGVSLFHLDGGPANAGADVGLVRFAPGTRFPVHGHGGEERYVVLQGRVLEDGGAEEVPGQEVVNGPAKVHAFVTDPGGDTVVAITLHGGLRIGGGSAPVDG